MKLGLFALLFWRVAAALAVAIAVLAAFAHFSFPGGFERAWRSDLQQQARWVARELSGSPPGIAGDPASTVSGQPSLSQVGLASGWRAAHDSVRLTIRDATGRVLADSHPERGPLPDAAQTDLLSGAASVRWDGHDAELVLSRDLPAPFLFRNGAWFGLALIVLLATAAVFPFIRALKRQFEQLSAFASRVAAGELGATLMPSERREVDALIRALNDMSLRLAAEEQRKRRLLTDVSHELRSPLARLRALADTIGRHPGEATTHLRGIESEVTLMNRLIGDLLWTARLEEQDGVLVLGDVDLHDWSMDAFQRLQGRIEDAGVRCNLYLAATQRQVHIDPQRLVQALGNLVENAIAATAGRVDPAIDLSLTIAERAWSLTVRDNGRGIPVPALPFIFDRFFRVDMHRDRRTGGVGLGMSLVKAIVVAHGGRPELDSVEGRGTSVRLVFPFSDAHSFLTNAASAPDK